MKQILSTVAAAVSLAVLVGGCHAASGTEVGVDPAPVPIRTQPVAMPCDPHGGFPRATSTCPDPEPETGWLTATGGQLTLTAFRTLADDATGQKYAEAHGVDFPFPNDYFDAPTGAARPLDLGPDTVCTGIIRVGYREPLRDHVVSCAELLDVAGSGRLSVAVWSTDATSVQVSELYRP
jgi:hypothetical protein